MRTTKRMILILALLVLCLTVLSVSAFAADEVASGTCGENLNWVLDDEGALTISGTGAMEDYGPWVAAPWGNAKSVVIEEGVTTIGWCAFAGCSNLTAVKIPGSVTTIVEAAFIDCTNLTVVEIDGGEISIGDNAFGGCEGLKDSDGFVIVSNTLCGYYGNDETVVIPKGVTNIAYQAFSNCEKIISVKIPNSVTNIGGSAFSQCKNLREIVIPDSVVSIEPYAFYYCSSLTNVSISKNVTRIDESTFGHCSSLTEIELPTDLTNIGPYAFSGCNNLTRIKIPQKVRYIGWSAFRYCSKLTSVEIPVSVTTIDSRAFEDCSSLSDVYYYGSVNQWEEINIESGNELLTSATIHYNYVSLLDMPVISSVENKSNGVTITWDGISEAEKYQLFVKTASSGWKSIGYTTGTTFTWKNATSGVTYTFGIRCTNADGSVYTSAFDSTGKTIQYIASPNVTKLEYKNNGIKITWDKIPGAAKYKLVVKESGGKWKTLWNTINTSYTWTGAESGKTYTFGVVCVTSDGKTVTSAFDSTGKTIKYIARPSIYKIANIANGVAVAWNKVPGAAKYKIVVKTATSGWKTVAYSTGSTYTWTGAKSGETYTFGIVCVTSDGKTNTSAFDSTGKTIKFISCPKIAKFEKVSGGLKIYWYKVVGAAKYKLIVKEPGGSWKTLWNTVNHSYIWTGAVKGKTYIFSLRCTTADGKSYTSGWNSSGWTYKYN